MLQVDVLKKRFFASKYTLLVLVLVVIYTGLFSFISIAKDYALNSDVWDLGYAYGYISSVAYGHQSFNGYITSFFYQGIVLVIFPIAYFKSLPVLLFFQSFMLALPIYLLFKISKLYNLSDRLSFIVSLCYFFYFPLAGAIWFDFHFQTLFVVLFLTGYLFYLKKRNLMAGTFLLLSGMVRFPYMGLVFLTIFSLIFSLWFTNFKENRVIFKIYEKGEKFLYFLLVISFFLLLIQYLWISYTNKSLDNIHITNNYNPLTDIYAKLLTILLIFGFMLFIPLFSAKWMLPALPFILLIFFANNTGYYYPELFLDWYSVSILPFLFLGFIEVIQKTQISGVKKHVHNSHPFFLAYTKRKLKHNLKSFLKPISPIEGRSLFFKKNGIYFVLFLLMGSAVFVEPYGPLNSHSFNDFNLQHNIEYNMTQYNAALKVIDLVPINEKYVLVQNDLPQLFVHDLFINNIIVSPYNIGPNVTTQDIKENHFPFCGGSKPGYIKINYVLANLNNIHSLTEPPFQKGFPTMDQILKQLLSSKYYGIKAYSDGIMLLERGYNSSPILFNIQNLSLNLKTLQLHSFKPPRPNLTLLEKNAIKMLFPTNNEVCIYGPFPYLTLLPFNYALSFNISYSGLINAKFISNVGYITGTNETFIFMNSTKICLENHTINNYRNYLENFTTTSFLDRFQINLYFISGSGTITINNIKLEFRS